MFISFLFFTVRAPGIRSPEAASSENKQKVPKSVATPSSRVLSSCVVLDVRRRKGMDCGML